MDFVPSGVVQTQVHAQSGISNVDIMTRIAVELAGSISELKTVGLTKANSSTGAFNSKAKFYVRIHTHAAITILLDYFNRYPVFNSKYLDYQDFVLFFNAIVAQDFSIRKHGTANFDRASNIIANMNSTRTVYEWDFLWSFSPEGTTWTLAPVGVTTTPLLLFVVTLTLILSLNSFMRTLTSMQFSYS